MKKSAPPETADSVIDVKTGKLTIDEIKKVKEEKKQQRKELNQHLRELREEVRDLSDFVGKVKLGLTSIKAGEPYIKKTKDDIQSLFVEIEAANKAFRSDTVRHITNLWEQIQANPVIIDPTINLSQQELLHALTWLEDRAAKIVLAVGHLTIPHRLNRWLEQARTGYYLPFHQLFEDELPNQADRNEVFRNIALAPKGINCGVICGRSGLIYRYEPKRNIRVRDLLLVVLLFCGLTDMIWALGNSSLPWMGYVIKSTDGIGPLLLPSWFAILVGISVHIAVSGVKNNRDSDLPPVISVKDWMLIFSARKGEIVVKLFLALIGLFSMAFLFEKEQFTVSSAFFVGYSLDSFIGLFGESMEKKATSQLSAFRKNLGLQTDGH